MLCIVFPNRVISQTTYNEELQPPKQQFIQADPEVAETLFQKWTIDKKVKTATRQYSSCVNYAKSVTGFNQVIGKARNWPINSSTPQVGGVVIMDESWAGHVAVITAIDGDSLSLKEANYVRDSLTTRAINRYDTKILGFWNP